MQTLYEPYFVDVRRRLLELERNRHDGRRRDLFWNAELWQRTLTELIEAERARDAEYLQQIAAAAQGSLERDEWLRTFYDVLDEDVEWHRKLLKTLRSHRERWEQDGMTRTEAVDELVPHEQALDDWLNARQVRLHEVTLEYLECCRYGRGKLERGVWARNWANLQRIWRVQELAWERTHGEKLSDKIIVERLKWCQQIRDIQYETARDWQGYSNFDQQGLHADLELVNTAIAKLSPPKTSPLGPFIAALVLIAFAIIAGMLMFMLLRAEVGLVEEQTTSITLPTSAPTTADAYTLNIQGLVRLAQGDCPGAIPLFQQAATIDPTFFEPPNNLAFCVYEQGDILGAIKYWQTSLMLKANNADGLAGLGMALYGSGQQDAGLMQYRTALQFNPNYADEHWLRSAAKWSERAISDSAVLRAQLSQN